MHMGIFNYFYLIGHIPQILQHWIIDLEMLWINPRKENSATQVRIPFGCVMISYVQIRM